MGSPWENWVHAQLEEQDRFVALLRSRVEAGDRIAEVTVRPHQISTPTGPVPTPPVYAVVLARGTELSVVIVPPSESFHRYCFARGIRMHDPAQEALRFGLLLGTPLYDLKRELGEAEFEQVLVEHLQLIGPPQTCDRLGDIQTEAPGPPRRKWEITPKINLALKVLAQHLVEDLTYSELQAAAILDEALRNCLFGFLEIKGLIVPNSLAAPSRTR